jgi:hypothetical protein
MFEQLKADIQRALESKRENDPQRLLKLLRDNPNKFLTSKEWSEIFKKPLPSTRRNLAGLQANDEIDRLGKKGTRGVKYGFGDIDTGVWYKKLLKTGKTTNPIRKTSLKIEIYTFEKNDKCRFDSLLEAVQKQVPELEYIDGAGYESSRDSEGENSPYQFESAYLIVQSGQDTFYYNNTVTLKDINEPPC